MTQEKITTKDAAIAFFRQHPNLTFEAAYNAVTDEVFSLFLKERYLVPSEDCSTLIFSEDKQLSRDWEYKLKLKEIEREIAQITWQAKERIASTETRQVEIEASKAIRLKEIEVDGNARLQESLERIQIASDQRLLAEQQMYLRAIVDSLPAIAQIATSTIPLFATVERNITSIE